MDNWIKEYTTDVFSASFFFFQAEDGIRDVAVTGVQTCALPILLALHLEWRLEPSRRHRCFAPSALSLCRVALARSCYGSTPGSPPAPRDSVFSDAGPSRQSTRALPPRGRKPPESCAPLAPAVGLPSARRPRQSR